MSQPPSAQQDIHSLSSENHVWVVNPDTVRNRAQLDACRALLSASETQRQLRFRRAEDRHRYLVSHALVRRVLSVYWPIPPQQWLFSYGERGKPEIANPEMPMLRFNLTHTHALAACMVSFGIDCGIDAEHLSTRHNPQSVAKRMFSATESRRLETLDGKAGLEYFYRCWTLREAYVKARGLGISFPTRKLRFSFTSTQTVQADFDADVDDDATVWDFRIFRPTTAHILATASRSEDRGIKPVRLFEFVF